MCEEFQSLVCDREIIDSNNRSQSPKLNGKNRISICYKESYIEDEENSRSFEMYVKSGVSFVLSKDLLDDLNISNKFTRADRWRWLDGELRVEEQIPSEYFVAIAFPCEDYKARVEKMKRFGYTKEWAQRYFKEDFYQILIRDIKSFIGQNDLDIPLVSIETGKLMGNLEEEFNKAFSESEEEQSL